MGVTLTQMRNDEVAIDYQRGTTAIFTFYFPGYDIASATFTVRDGAGVAVLSLTGSPGITILNTTGGDTVKVTLSVANGNAIDLGDDGSGSYTLLPTLADGTIGSRVQSIFTVSEIAS